MYLSILNMYLSEFKMYLFIFNICLAGINMYLFILNTCLEGFTMCLEVVKMYLFLSKIDNIIFIIDKHICSMYK